jgi:hypothetical protein
MEKLKTQSILLDRGGKREQYQVEEKDHGDMIVYDISRDNHYLMTVARDGSIVYMNFEAPEKEKEIFKLSCLHQMIDSLQSINSHDV